MIHLSTLGPLSIDIGATRLTAASPAPCAAMLYLIVERGKEIQRRTFIELLYPDSPEEAAAHRLRQLLYRLRQMGVPLANNPAAVCLARDAATWDVEAIDSGARYSDEQLDALARGYLADFSLEISQPFSDWLDAHRSDVSKRLRRSLLAQVHDAKSKHRFHDVDRAARACLALDPLNEEATLATAEALVMSGSKMEALAVLDRYIDDVGSRPRDLQFAPKLLRERISQYVADQGLLAEPPLIGRDEEITTLRGLLSRVKAGVAEGCVVWGQSGIGKTRLLNEACAIAALDGIAVVRCSLQPHDQRRPLAVLRDFAPRLLDLPGSLGCSPDSLALMRGLCGRGEMPRLETPRTTQDSEVALAGVIAKVTDLLDAVCSERAVLLCIEDAHWLDPASIELLVEAVGGQRSLGVLMASQRSLQLPLAFADAARLHSIQVSQLAKPEATALMHRLFERAHRTIDTDVVEWATGLADGVPFYLRSLFVEYVNTGDRTAIPSTLTASLASRLERLADPARSVLDAIVVLGKLCTVARLEAVVQLPRYELLNSLRELEERGLTRAVNNTVSYAHELFAVTARTKMAASVASSLHRAAAELLESERSDPSVAPWDIADHWVRSGDSSRALSVMLVCAEEALLVGRPQEAVAMLINTTALAVSAQDRRRYLNTALAACEAAGEWSRAVGYASELLQTDAREGIEPSPHLRIQWVYAAYSAGLSVTGERDRLVGIARDMAVDKSSRVRATMILLYLAEDTCDATVAMKAIESLNDLPEEETNGPKMVFETVFGNPKRANELAKIVIRQAVTGPKADRSNQLQNPAYALLRTGDTRAAIQLMTALYEEFEKTRRWSGCVQIAAKLAEVYWCEDDLSMARTWHERGAESLARSSYPDAGAHHYGMRIILALDEGRPDQAVAALTEIGRLYPYVLEGRRSVYFLANQIRIDLANNTCPSMESVDRLLAGHTTFRGIGMVDVIADTLLMALKRVGRMAEANSVKSEYLRTFRRDAVPPAKRLRELQPNA